MVDEKPSGYFTTKATTMLLTPLIVLALTPIGSAADSNPGVLPSPSSTADKRCSANDRDWPNPYIGVNTTNSVVVIARGVPISKYGVPLKDLRAYLGKLPKTAWPCGRVVAAQQRGISTPDDRDAIKRNCRKVNRALRRLNMKANWWSAV